MSTLSVIIITKNEAKNITACLESVSFADEIIVLDSGSSDETIPLCLKFTPKVYQVDWPGYGTQKNRAIEKSHCKWVLSIDADEVVTPKLKHEILTAIQQDTGFNAYAICRKSTYCAQLIAYGDWRNDYCIRLFKRGVAKFKELPVHESLEVQGKIGILSGHIEHHSFSSLEEVLTKLNEYSTLSAEYKYAEGKKSSLFKALIHSTWTFFRGYVLRMGFMDGKRGFMLAVSNAQGCYYRYLKMMLLSEQGYTRGTGNACTPSENRLR